MATFTKLLADLENIQKLADKPNINDGLTPAELKALFDKAGVDIQDYINNTFIAELEKTTAESGASRVGVESIAGLTGNDVQTLLEALKALVDTKASENATALSLAELGGWIEDNDADILALQTDKADTTYVNSEIATVQGQIDTNDTDILALQTDKADTTYVDGEITTVQGQINSNDTDISNLQGDVTALENRDDNLQLQINMNDSYISDLESGKADKTNVLEKDNTTAYTPTTDYHPATKAYVDGVADGIASGGLSADSVENIHLDPDIKIGSLSSLGMMPPQDSVSDALVFLSNEISDNSFELTLKADKDNVLEKDNTTAFTPTGDYHPATKKYVDDNAPESAPAVAPEDGRMIFFGLSTEGYTSDDVDYLCDGVDDIVQINAALGTVSTGEKVTLFFFDGTYHIGSGIVTTTPNISFVGTPGNFETKPVTFQSDVGGGVTVDGANVTFKNIYFDAERVTSNAEYVSFIDCAFLLAGHSAFQLGADHNVIERCYVESQGFDGVIVDARHCLVKDTVSKNALRYSFYIKGDYNRVINCSNIGSTSIEESLYIEDGYQLNSKATKTYVSDCRFETGLKIVDAIQCVIERCEFNDESHINKLESSTIRNCVFTGVSLAATLKLPYDVTFEQNKLIGAGAESNTNYVLAVEIGQKLRIKDNLFAGTNTRGIFLNEYMMASLDNEDILISGNVFDLPAISKHIVSDIGCRNLSIVENTFYSGATCIDLDNSSSLEGLIISNNNLGNFTTSIEINNQIMVDISSNIMEKGVIKATTCSNLTIDGNVFKQGGVNTVQIDSCSYVSVTNNNIKQCTNGIYVLGASAPLTFTIANNTIHDASQHAIYLQNADSCNIIGNRSFWGNVKIDSCDRLNFVGNSITTQEDAALHLVTCDRANITGNTLSKGAGEAADYSATQYSILIETADDDILISSNCLWGKDYVKVAGSGVITAVNNVT